MHPDTFRHKRSEMRGYGNQCSELRTGFSETHTPDRATRCYSYDPAFAQEYDPVAGRHNRLAFDLLAEVLREQLSRRFIYCLYPGAGFETDFPQGLTRDSRGNSTGFVWTFLDMAYGGLKNVSRQEGGEEVFRARTAITHDYTCGHLPDGLEEFDLTLIRNPTGICPAVCERTGFQPDKEQARILNSRVCSPEIAGGLLMHTVDTLRKGGILATELNLEWLVNCGIVGTGEVAYNYLSKLEMLRNVLGDGTNTVAVEEYRERNGDCRPKVVPYLFWRKTGN